MLKLLVITLLLNSVLGASQNTKIEEYLHDSFSKNPAITKLDVKVVDRVAIPKMKDWDALIISINATLKAKPKPREIKQKMIWFSNGDIITKELIDIKTGESLKDLVKPSLQAHHYKKENLIYGNINAKHKVAIFSDPLCPFCRTFVPDAIQEMKKQPKKFAIYYYHFPLPAIHPAAVPLAKAAIAAELQGKKNVVLDMYKVEVNAKEKDVNKILKAFNKVMKTNIKASDLTSAAVMKHYKNDQSVASDVMVNGTPTLFFDDKVDKSKRKYQKVK